MSDYGRRRYRFGVHGQPRHWNRRQQLGDNKLEDAFKFSPGDTITLGPIINADNLIANYKQMEREGGQAPGPDGIRFGDLGRRERADILRAASNMIASGDYRPGPARHVDIPKPTGGTRTLTIRNTPDRVIPKAVFKAITPVIDPQLLDCSMGFRPGRNIQQLLAAMEAAVIQQDRPVIVTDDIRKAFDYVSIEGAIRAFAWHVADADTMCLIESILRGHEGQSRQVGIDQGDPLSPLALNVLLDQVLDRPLLAAHPGTPFWRYADNLVWVCQSVSDGCRVLQEARQLLDAAGFALKGDYGPVNLRRQGAPVDLLGFRIRRHSETQLAYELTRDAWWSLKQQLIRAHEAPEPARTASMALRGWLEAHGPAFGDVSGRDVVDGVLHTAAQVGFWETDTEEELLNIVEKAYERWMCIRSEAFSTGYGIHGGSSPSIHDADALRASQRPRSPSGDAEVGLAGSIPAQTGAIP